ncbi:MAG: isoaspartyl peptidase/L-asparaginase [Acidobacteriota bacterium]
MDNVNRRDFMKSIAAAGALTGIPAQAAESGGQGPVFLSTWKHGKPANDRAAEVFSKGGSLLDAVEKGINVPEEDPKVSSVGYGGLPNAEGVVELDAGIMDGTRHRAGAVCGLRGVKTPISVARLVLEGMESQS